jgi:hypothetical protein
VAGYERERLSASVTNAVYQLNGYVCHLCGRPIDRSLKFPDSFSRSIDHLIPVSLGGSDSFDNLLPAHLGCNIARSNRELDMHRAGMIATALSEKELRIVVMHGTPVQFGPKYYQPVVEGFSRKRFALWHVWKAIKYPVLAVFAIAMIPVAWYGGLFALRLIATLGYVAPQVFWALVIVCVWLLTRRGQRRGRSARARRAAATRRRNAEYDRLRDGLSAKARRSASVDPSQMPKQLTDVSGYLSKCVIAWTELTDIPETFLVPGSGVAKRLEA